MSEAAIRCGLLGPGRARNGLGPYLARWFEKAGVEVAAVAGRDPGRTAAAAAAMAEEFGHPVDARDGVEALVAPGDLDVLVIAAPPEAHLAGLCAGLEAGLAVLTEKPLVPVEQTDEVMAVCAEFAARGQVLEENCQWPETLPAFDRLHPGRAPHASRLDIRLSPSHGGLGMLVDSFSHYLSLAQAVAPLDASTRVAAEFSAPPDGCEALEVRLRFEGDHEPLDGRFELVRCPAQPRPAWYAIDDRRLEREVRMEDYAMFARSGDSSIPMDDPLRCLVYRFADAVREPRNERIQRDAERIRQRARLFRDVVVAWEAGRA